MKKIIIIIPLLILGGIIWVVYNTSANTKKYNKAQPAAPLAIYQQSPTKEPDTESQKDETKNGQIGNQDYSDWSNDSLQAVSPFPSPVAEKIDGLAQRTVHMGVRQWEWVPAKIAANYGEKVILIMHNTDVTHSISIPDLDVKQDIPEDGAVVQFMASKRGTFTFLCDTPCGEGHNQMKGEITIV
ncbi:MAG: hypothetical protein CO141_00195 [Candidatus Moranbacteria bacterium CG_4_9_14_3_um_filter_42_9]|nr:MAG: hypothetical protein CO141_00195 [Candidatus Moranbacteria bacterium CG_4_9_14_3_um_filter_42_9]